MHNTDSSSAGFQVNNTQVMVGAVLLGAGCMLGIAGMIIGSHALVSSCSRWLRELEVPPTQVMRHKWDQTRAATMAGAHAWHSSNGIQAHSRA
jgi:hypothetical protein